MKKIKASAIYYALFLSVIFGLILGGFILFSGFNQNFALQMDIEEILIDNSTSGIAYGQANFKEIKNNKPQLIRLYGQGVDSVEITKKTWGAFTIIQSTATHRNRQQTKIALMGGTGKEELPNLYLVDNGRPISLCGDARIEGVCKLPKAGLKRAYIEGKNYTGGKMVFGTIKPSEKHLPEINTHFVNNIATHVKTITLWKDDIDTLNATFSQEGIHYLADDYIRIENIAIKGQIIIEAKDSIFIGQDAQIENAIIKSKIVYIESGFSGTMQVFATEKIILEEFVQLKYPSVLGIIEKEYPTKNGVEILIGENSQVIGTVFIISEKPNFRMLPKLSIQKNAEIDGLVYCTGKTQLKGTIKGSLFAQKLYLRTASSAYENYLLDGKILNQLPIGFITANLFEKTNLLKHIAWVE